MNAEPGPDSGCQCRLLVIGPSKTLQSFDRKEVWPEEFTEVEPLEMSPTRRSWQFSAPKPPLPYLRTVSTRWPLLMFFLDYETERVKGLASLKAGKLRHRRVVYPP